MEMEMDISKLNAEDMPALEKALIAEMSFRFPAGYLFSFSVEENTNIMARDHFKYLNQFSNIALLRAGSGGRLDGAGVGDQEFILLTLPMTPNIENNILEEHDIQPLIEKIKSCNDLGIQKNIVCIVEHKDLSQGVDTLIYHSSSRKPFPGRILEAVFLVGNKSIFQQAKFDTLTALYGNVKVVKKIKEELKTYKDTMMSGETYFKKQLTPQFVEKYNTVLYDPSKNIYGFKYGPLRYMQLALALEFYMALAKKQVEPEFFFDLPSALEDRIRFVFRKMICNPLHENVLMDLAIIYTKTSNIQTKLKLDYHARASDLSTPVIVFLSKNTIPILKKFIAEYPLGEILLVK